MLFESPATTGARTSFDERLGQAIDDARAGGAGEDQLAILERSRIAGEITLEDDRTAARATIACMIDSGVEAKYSEYTTNAGLLIPGYEAAVSDTFPPPEEKIIDACDAQEFSWVSQVYQLQPSSQDLTDAHVEKQLPALRECLIENGVAVDEKTPKQELLWDSVQLLTDTDGAVDCAWEAGIDSA